MLTICRTPAPCGMPKGESSMSLLAGASVNITWHLGYPHRGQSAHFSLRILARRNLCVVTFQPHHHTHRNLSDNPLNNNTARALQHILKCHSTTRYSSFQPISGHSSWDIFHLSWFRAMLDWRNHSWFIVQCSIFCLSKAIWKKKIRYINSRQDFSFPTEMFLFIYENLERFFSYFFFKDE